jgi:RND family efflux transporter MFP subunit
VGRVVSNLFVCSAILGVAVAGAVVLYLNRPEPAKVEVESTPLVVDVAEVVKQDVPISIDSQGTVSARTQTLLIAEVSGRVVEVSDRFKAGGFFEAGDMLLQIDDRDYRAELKRAEAAVASAKSNLALEKGRAEVAYRDWLKFSNGVKRNSEADALAQRKPQLAEAQAQLDSAEADLIRARDNLDRTTLRLPYDGMVQQKHVDIGQYVSVGTQLAKTFAVDRVEVRLPIPDDRLNYLNLPSIAGEQTQLPAVTLSARMGDQVLEWPAQLVRTEGVLDERSRVLFAVAEVSDPYGMKTERSSPLRIGTFVQASISGKTMSDIVVLPRHILRTGNQVWVVDDRNRLINRQVKLLRTDGALAYIYQGLEDGERVSLSSAPHAVAGTEVKLNSSVKTSSLLSAKAATASRSRGADKGV